jgi:hypothetical protein
VVAIGVVEGALRPRPRREFGVGVRAGFASDAANRDWCGCGGGGGGVVYAEGVVDRRRLRRLAASPGDENVLPIGLEFESSGEDAPVNIFHQIRHTYNDTNTNT